MSLCFYSLDDALIFTKCDVKFYIVKYKQEKVIHR